ncbi:sensor histidine kinase [Hoyosella altamirensis]|uniref:Signal transduction histidine kinase n=1 Tax=Hoyosella altamirensis TaxID=616997 RepID=A0A839RMI5_9ACTN|nr:ATP-binding protein [Hoyosella altamirensis]MBB3038142.1 signal transduction histidine kinase [Hoyosella altamirensis]
MSTAVLATPHTQEQSAVTVAEPITPAAYHKVFRTFALVLGVAGVSLGLLNQQRVAREFEILPLWWSIPALAAVFASTLVLALTAYFAPIRILCFLLRTISIGYVLALITWPLAHSGPPLEDDFRCWLWSVNALAAMAAAVAWPPRIALPYLALIPAGSVLLNAYAAEYSEWGNVIEDIAMATTAATVYVSMGLIGLNTGWRLDEIKASAQARAAKAAATAARNQERERIDGLIHDGVISTLLNASQGGDTAVLARQSRRTLDQIDGLRAGVEAAQAFRGSEAVAYLRSAAMDISEDAVVNLDAPHEMDSFTIPAYAVRAIGAGLAEALTNSIRHADVPGRTTHRTVSISMYPERCRVSVHDNGKGFDPRSTPADRLGLAVSIRGRMARVPGGSSRVESTPGGGTNVTLFWRSSDD